MELDARRLADGSVIDADLCIIGAGPAGMTVASEFLGLGTDVLLLESGGRDSEDWPQTLNLGAVSGDYAGLGVTRSRRLGGTTALWNTPVGRELGAKYAPLDPWDFAPPRKSGLTGWPLSPADLLPLYRRAQTVCGLGPFGYEAADWVDPRRRPLSLSGDVLTTRVYQFGARRPFATIYPGHVRESANVRLCLHATVCGLTTDLGGKRVVEARVGAPNGRWHRVRAKTFVMACGTIENTRLLLASALGNHQVGCCFMEHPRDYALTLIPDRPDLLEHGAFYDAHRTAGNSFVGGRLALTEHAVRDLGHPNASLTLLPRLRKGVAPGGLAERMAQRLKRVLSAGPQEGYGWSRVPNPARFFDAFRILTNLEQRPHPENRITLGPKRDALGMPRSRLQWRWRSEEQAELCQLRGALVASIESSGLGRVEVDPHRPVDPNAHHHSGTTRMAADPRDGVVDADGRVHGVRNLFVAGASVFPTAGFANPTLTVVALALRLADHLKARA